MNESTVMQKSILIIDDDQAIRRLLSILLELEDYAVKEAEDGEDARRIITQSTHLPDLILLDMMMPRLDGLGFLRWLRNESGLKVPVVAVTGMSRAGGKEEMLAAGANLVLFKPLAADHIVEQIRPFLSATAALTV